MSGFGWSGTNAHVVLEGYGIADDAPADTGSAHWAAGAARPVAISMPESEAEPPRDGLDPRETRVLPLSGRSDAAVRELARGYLAWLDERAEELASQGDATDPLLSDTAWTAGTGRSHFDHRAGVVFRDAASLRDGLLALAEADDGTGPGTASKVAFAYTGQASQWVGMGEALYRSEPVYRAVLDRCDALLRDERDGTSLLDVMFGRSGAAGDLDDPMWKQPAIYALECALTALWSSLGVRPDVVLGHSLGEIAAAHTAGVFGLEEGLRFAAARGSLIGALPGEGAMAAVFAPASRRRVGVGRAQRGHRGTGSRHRRRQRRTPGGERTGGGHRGDHRALRGGGSPGQATEEESRLPQRHGGAGPGRPGSRASGVRVRSPVDPPGEQPHRTSGGARHGARRVVLAPPGPRAGRASARASRPSQSWRWTRWWRSDRTRCWVR